MCEFCENAPTRYGDIRKYQFDCVSDSYANLYFIKNRNKIFFLTTGAAPELKINYCPMCGRKLGE